MQNSELKSSSDPSLVCSAENPNSPFGGLGEYIRYPVQQLFNHRWDAPPQSPWEILLSLGQKGAAGHRSHTQGGHEGCTKCFKMSLLPSLGDSLYCWKRYNGCLPPPPHLARALCL